MNLAHNSGKSRDLDAFLGFEKVRRRSPPGIGAIAQTRPKERTTLGRLDQTQLKTQLEESTASAFFDVRPHLTSCETYQQLSVASLATVEPRARDSNGSDTT
jgi:hypothetical protein